MEPKFGSTLCACKTCEEKAVSLAIVEPFVEKIPFCAVHRKEFRGLLQGIARGHGYWTALGRGQDERCQSYLRVGLVFAIEFLKGFFDFP